MSVRNWRSRLDSSYTNELWDLWKLLSELVSGSFTTFGKECCGEQFRCETDQTSQMKGTVPNPQEKLESLTQRKTSKVSVLNLPKKAWNWAANPVKDSPKSSLFAFSKLQHWRNAFSDLWFRSRCLKPKLKAHQRSPQTLVFLVCSERNTSSASWILHCPHEHFENQGLLDSPKKT